MSFLAIVDGFVLAILIWQLFGLGRDLWTDWKKK